MFKIRKTKPGKGNLNYITVRNKGWNTCVQGKPKDKYCDALANCVGYASGRFNEIYNEIKGTTGCKFTNLNSNAEAFIRRAKEAGLDISHYPVKGGIMVWQKGEQGGSDGAGHVEIVEEVLETKGKEPIKVYNSASNYGGAAFFNVTRTNSNGRWGLSSRYTYIGCVVNPAVDACEPEPKPEPTLKFKVGDKVVINGALYKSANASKATGSVKNKTTEITRVYPEGKHPYNTKGDLGWMDEKDIKKYTAPDTSLKVGDKVKIIARGNASASGDGHSAGGIGWTREILQIYKGKKFPYRVGNKSGTTGFYKAEALDKQ